MEMKINVNREAREQLKFRKSVRNLSDEELAALREAYNKMMEIDDERGYLYHAGIHGLPLPVWCQHGNQLFPPWHRAYLYFFEQAVEDQVPGVTLPWWDWTSEKSRAKGLPKAFADEKTPDGQPNPLYKAPLIVCNRKTCSPETDRGYGELLNRDTRRYPGEGIQGELPDRNWLRNLLALSHWDDFINELEDMHNFIHVWTGGVRDDVLFLFSADLAYQSDLDQSQIPDGLRQEFENNERPLTQNATVSIAEQGSKWVVSDVGVSGRIQPLYSIIKGSDKLNVYRIIQGDMGQVPIASYDPIFWSHHSMVDRLWWLWQLRHHNFGMPRELLGQVLTPFPMTVADTLDIHDLGYEYAATEVISV